VAAEQLIAAFCGNKKVASWSIGFEEIELTEAINQNRISSTLPEEEKKKPTRK
jgi:hypothetical protein